MAEVAAADAGLAEEEGDDGREGLGARREDLRAHSGDPAEVEGGEIEGAEEMDGGFEVGERGGDDRRVGGD